jgi:hypothetical protein
MRISNILVLTLRCKLINFAFQISLPFFSEKLAGFTSYIFQIILIYFTLMQVLQFHFFPLI